jgi:hypothetical protein
LIPQFCCHAIPFIVDYESKSQLLSSEIGRSSFIPDEGPECDEKSIDLHPKLQKGMQTHDLPNDAEYAKSPQWIHLSITGCSGHQHSACRGNDLQRAWLV